MSGYLAVISIGTNSTRVLLADAHDGRPHVAVERSIGTRLGEGVGESGMLGEEPMERTLEAVRVHAGSVRGHYLRLYAIATSAVRRATNRDAFSRAVERITGVPLRVLSGEEEAAASFRGALASLPPSSGTLTGAIDVGGGSTEYAIGEGNLPQRSLSVELGAVRLTEAVPELGGQYGPIGEGPVERARALAGERLAPLSALRGAQRIALVGGSATSAASLIRAKRGRIERYELTRERLEATFVRLCALGIEERRALEGVKAQRADILPAGVLILASALECLKMESATVTAGDLLLGYLLQQQDALAVARHQGGTGGWWNR
ncbi:MAG: hypothetical protein HKL91_02725 [Candidatus Eremiobacteraeota bacterium]|uniref:Ppx/GppA phosphatase N-terminal domain-containing protein n=1 Tax=mine drainage metagenome TaxID=410659 RepID=E6PIP7_9ZZZZ|nr:hypothetical protein [Candidatus Eremiobacteraeota bacterium]